MTSFRPFLVGAIGSIAVAPAAGYSSDPLDWFSVSTPGQSALYRFDAGLLGQSESPSTLVDLCARGGSYTGIELAYQSEKASNGPLAWNRQSVDFGIETAVEALPGLVFGLDATDHHPKTSLSDGSSEWRLFDPQGGLRLGGGVDLLRNWREKSPWRWVVAGWIPVFSQAREWELRTGAIWARKLRVDVSAAWASPASPAHWAIPVDSSTKEDTTWWRSDKFRWTARVGGSPAKDISLQAWVGQRELRDPGAGSEPSWRTWGRAIFAGTQASLKTGIVDWDGEARVEQGDQSLLFDGSSVFAFAPDSGKARSSVDFTAGSSRIKASLPVAKSASIWIDLSCAWMDLSNGVATGQVLAPASSRGNWSSTRRLAGLIGARAKIYWLDMEPFAGIQRRMQDGDDIPMWQELAPRGAGRSWSVPAGLEISRSGSMNGKVGYKVTGEIWSMGSLDPTAGLRHQVEMKQGF